MAQAAIQLAQVPQDQEPVQFATFKYVQQANKAMQDGAIAASRATVLAVMAAYSSTVATPAVKTALESWAISPNDASRKTLVRAFMVAAGLGRRVPTGKGKGKKATIFAPCPGVPHKAFDAWPTYLRRVLPVVAYCAIEAEIAPRIDGDGHLVVPIRLTDVDAKTEGMVTLNETTKEKSVASAARNASKLLGHVKSANTREEEVAEEHDEKIAEAEIVGHFANWAIKVAVRPDGEPANWESISKENRELMQTALLALVTMRGCPVLWGDPEEYAALVNPTPKAVKVPKPRKAKAAEQAPAVDLPTELPAVPAVA